MTVLLSLNYKKIKAEIKRNYFLIKKVYLVEQKHSNWNSNAQLDVDRFNWVLFLFERTLIELKQELKNGILKRFFNLRCYKENCVRCWAFKFQEEQWSIFDDTYDKIVFV